MFALIVNNRVSQISEDEMRVHSTLEVVDTQEIVTVGMAYSGGVFSEWIEPIENLRAHKTALAVIERQARIDAGFDYQGHTYQIADDDLSVMDRFMLGLTVGFPSPHGGYFRDVDNVNVAMSDVELGAFIQVAAVYSGGLRAALHVLKDAIADAADQAALDLVDIDAGWPLNNG